MLCRATRRNDVHPIHKDVTVTVIYVFTCSLLGCHGYWYGVPGGNSSVCVDMIPDHGKLPENSSAPFRVVSHSRTYYSGGKITVSLETVTDTPFKGFLLQARTLGSDDPLGRFFVGNSTDVKHITCGQYGHNNALSHNDNSTKTKRTFSWQNLQGSDVYFVATFVVDYNTSWREVRSEVVREVRVPDSTVGTTQHAPAADTCTCLTGHLHLVLYSLPIVTLVLTQQT